MFLGEGGFADSLPAIRSGVDLVTADISEMDAEGSRV